jgi:hypothetical protein
MKMSEKVEQLVGTVVGYEKLNIPEKTVQRGPGAQLILCPKVEGHLLIAQEEGKWTHRIPVTRSNVEDDDNVQKTEDQVWNTLAEAHPCGSVRSYEEVTTTKSIRGQRRTFTDYRLVNGE